VEATPILASPVLITVNWMNSMIEANKSSFDKLTASRKDEFGSRLTKVVDGLGDDALKEALAKTKSLLGLADADGASLAEDVSAKETNK